MRFNLKWVLCSALIAAGTYAMACSLTKDGNIWVVKTGKRIVLTDDIDTVIDVLASDCGVPKS